MATVSVSLTVGERQAYCDSATLTQTFCKRCGGVLLLPLYFLGGRG